MKWRTGIWSFLLLCSILFPTQGLASEKIGASMAITDGIGQQVEVSAPIEHVICSGSGCLRLLTYLKGQHLVVAVEDNEKRKDFGPRPYALANPHFKGMPLMGEFRGNANPELILGLNPLPQVIFKTYPNDGIPAHVLNEKTGIPVIGLNYGNLAHLREDLYASLRIMGKVIDREERAEAIVNFFEKSIADLKSRVQDVPEAEQRTCYVGGVASRGAHGFRSTELAYPPFIFTKARHVATADHDAGAKNTHVDVAREKLLEWDPEVIFIDLATLNAGGQASALSELKNDPIYQELQAVKSGEVYGVLPYNWYTQNFGSILADAYFVGKVLYPERFQDIDPSQKADEIYTFLVGKGVFNEMNALFENMAFQKISLK
ncbi:MULTISPECIES: iron ABC transporter substrate-binding protein [Aminobacterium]|jgi:iron complex transport system substrate-binding protein|uniref:iron ABC transporter substrate-binding protein n=1 Tax=Aminobacterium TaxID=81466 RepID=UPI000A4DCDA0|nr:iron ABC transporter substrate-binding protein [Aminobacterium sp. EBM-42]MDD2378950.1 iron ABC transporter substrate-binding protein [Aminobacterium colombiense]MDD3767483.1 iron ABC transporter substrate-binding protein [Aminobacterium colombiense]MDD4265605.1 iron ABC transporter substrate-binding protein [Aminobacterium colombiense]MDD4586575.1 iron ABC transporter substrate-binding protein [Aminobacterium colombiense]NLK30239.1 iron ABC transporter substrate-binding protein [Aminobacte